MKEYLKIRKAANGDEDAFIELLEEYRGYLYKCAYYHLGNREDALDAIGEMSYRAYRSRKKLKENSKNIKGWFIKILINCCRDMRKVPNNLVELEQVSNIQKIQGLVYEECFMDNYDLFIAVKGMKEPYREVIILRFLQDMKIKDIAMVLDKPESTVKSQIKRGLQMLKEDLKEDKYVG